VFSMFNEAKEIQNSQFSRYVYIVKRLAQKGRNFLLTAFNNRFRKWLCSFLEIVLRFNLSWPKLLPELTPVEIYLYARSKFRYESASNIKSLLVRATAAKLKDVYGDTPCREVYADEAFGWRAFTNQIEIVDVDAGHMTLLQEPYVESLASKLNDYFIKEGLKLG